MALPTQAAGPILTQVVESLDSKSPVIPFLLARDRLKGPPSIFSMHYALEMGVVLSGSFRQHGTSCHRDYEAGDVWFCGTWEPHAFEIPEPSAEVLAISIWPQFLAQLRQTAAPDLDWGRPFARPLQERPILGPNGRLQAREIARRFLRSLQHCPQETETVRSHLLVMELLLLFCEASIREPPLPARQVDWHERLSPALELACTANRLVTNEEAARACSFSTSRFIRQFKSSMGISFAKFALRDRLNRAAQVILNENTPLKAVAYRFGFTDSSHFNRLFRKHYGCLPLQYRKRLQASKADH